MLSIAVRYVAALAVLVVGDILWLGYFAHAVFQPTLKPYPAPTDRLARGGSFLPSLCRRHRRVRRSSTCARQSLGVARTWLRLVVRISRLHDLRRDELATISAWTIRLAVMDVGWGTFISGVAGLGELRRHARHRALLNPISPPRAFASALRTLHFQWQTHGDHGTRGPARSAV